MYGEGVSREGCIVDIGADLDILDKSGAWYSYSGTRLGQGRENVKEFLKQNKDVAAEIEAKIREAVLTPAKPQEDEIDGREESAAPGSEA